MDARNTLVTPVLFVADACCDILGDRVIFLPLTFFISELGVDVCIGSSYVMVLEINPLRPSAVVLLRDKLGRIQLLLGRQTLVNTVVSCRQSPQRVSSRWLSEVATELGAYFRIIFGVTPGMMTRAFLTDNEK